MNPKQFLIIGGTVLVLVGILGFIGIIGPTANNSIFGSYWWFYNAENWAHLVLGAVGIIAAFIFGVMWRKYLVVTLGVVGVLVGLYSLGGTKFLGANLENPADTLLHLVVGGWALWASMKPEKMM